MNGKPEEQNEPGFDTQIRQAEQRTEQAEVRTQQAEARTEQARTRIEQAETRTEQAETRTELAKTRTEQAEVRTEQAETRSEQAIRASEVRYRRLFETAQEGIIILDADTGQVVDANPFMKDLLGYSQEEFLGRKFWEIAPFKGEAACKITFEELKLSDRVRGDYLPLETKDGRRVEVELISNAYLVEQKRLIQCNIRDITGRRKLEAQFIEAQKMEVIGQLAGGVAHDFNNILEIIIGYNNLIQSDLEPDSPLRKYAEEIQRSADCATGLTRQLLIFSRKQKVQPVVLDLDDTVKSLDKMLRRLIDGRIEMTVVPGKETGHIKADPGYIWQVLMNLVVNARDAMPDGGILTIATRNVMLDESHARIHPGIIPGDYVMLSVSDTGTGMTDEVKVRIFEAFFTTKPAGKGTGLGLATCRTIVKQSGGCIDVDSEVGKGTTFKIHFPRVDEPLDADTKVIKAGFTELQMG